MTWWLPKPPGPLRTRFVEDAKTLLMRGGLSEQDAFDFIQKTAMRERLRMRVVAEQVLSGELTT